MDKVSIEDLHKECAIESMETRLNTLRLDYIYSALENNNPMIIEANNNNFNYTKYFSYDVI